MKRILWMWLFLMFAGSFVKAGSLDTIYLNQRNKRPYLTVFKPANSNENTAVIICSGGSYGRTADMEEGLPAAKLLAANGITAFLLDYRLPHGIDSIPLADGSTAMRYVREHCRQYHIQKNKIGIMGFSAGGHLASTLGTHLQKDSRPDFMVLLYPVISMADSLTHLRSRMNLLGTEPTREQITNYSNELQVSTETPGTFLVAAIDDAEVSIKNSLLFEAALRQQGVPVEMFVYAKGGHGFGIDNSEATIQWTDQVIPWIIKKQWKRHL